MKLLRRVVQPLLVTSLLFCAVSVFAQSPQPRLGSAISGTARVVLPNSRTPRVAAAQDLGALSPDTAVPGITLVFKRSAQQEAALQDLLAAQQNPASTLYHQWLTPDTFAARFGIADEDIATTENWLTSRGFRIDNVARSRDRITFSGTAAQVQAAFGAELHHYQAENELHVAPASDLTLPADLASVTAAVLHLSDFRPKPSYKALTGAHPEYTTLSTQTHYLAPQDIATMYDLNPLYKKGFYGSGQALAVVGQSYINLSSISTFQQYLTQNNPITTVLVPNSGVEAISPGDEGESEIDLEYSSGIAQNASIFLVYVGDNQNYDVFDSLAYAIAEKIAPVVSISYGACEAALSANDLDQENALFEEAAAQGQTLVASSGDTGSTSCAYYSSAQGISVAQQQALAVEFPASSPYVIAVGGTQMAPGTFTAGASSYWAAATNRDNVSSLLSYVPEVVWNEGLALDGLAAGGGGVSAHYHRAAWQSGVPGIAIGAFRLLPDIALQASIANPGFVVCSHDPFVYSSSGQTFSCSNGLLGSNGRPTVLGGTSFAAPVFAGFLAILNGVEHANGAGNIGPELYTLAANPTTYAAAFHDITIGANACVPGIPYCSTAGQSSYQAMVGYDQATGLGSVDFNALATAWPSTTTNLIPTTTSLTASATTAIPGATVPIQISVQPFSSTTAPSGSVSISVDGTVVNPSLTLSPAGTNATATYNFVAPATTGSHLVAVAYSGDTTHSSSSATYAVLVGNVAPSGGMSLTAANLTIASNGSGTTQITVTPNAGYSGRVVWSLTVAGTVNSPSVSYCYIIPSLAVNNVSTTQFTIGIGIACNSPLASIHGDLGRRAPIDRDAQASGATPPHSHSTPPAALYATLVICGLLARRRKMRLTLLLAIASLAIATTGLTGCGGGNSTTVVAPNLASYFITLRATDSVNSSITASTTFTLSVN